MMSEENKLGKKIYLHNSKKITYSFSDDEDDEIKNDNIEVETEEIKTDDKLEEIEKELKNNVKVLNKNDEINTEDHFKWSDTVENAEKEKLKKNLSSIKSELENLKEKIIKKPSKAKINIETRNSTKKILMEELLKIETDNIFQTFIDNVLKNDIKLYTRFSVISHFTFQDLIEQTSKINKYLDFLIMAYLIQNINDTKSPDVLIELFKKISKNSGIEHTSLFYNDSVVETNEIVQTEFGPLYLFPWKFDNVSILDLIQNFTNLYSILIYNTIKIINKFIDEYLKDEEKYKKLPNTEYTGYKILIIKDIIKKRLNLWKVEKEYLNMGFTSNNLPIFSKASKTTSKLVVKKTTTKKQSSKKELPIEIKDDEEILNDLNNDELYKKMSEIDFDNKTSDHEETDDIELDN